MNAYEYKMQASDMCYVCFESRHTGACARANCPQARRVPRKVPDFAEEAPATPVSYKQATDPTVPNVHQDCVVLTNIRCAQCNASNAPTVIKGSHGELRCIACKAPYRYDLREPEPAPTDRALANHFEKYPGALPDLDQEPPHADEAAYREQVMGLLAERQTTHGNFSDNARIAQALRQFFRSEHRGWHQLNWRQAEALDQIAGKLSRILSGQGGFEGHWEDIAGYATLAAKPEVQ